MPGETISCHFVLTNVLSDDITTVMNSYWNVMARAKSGLVQIRLTLQDAEVLSSRVKTESIKYEIMTVVISSLRTLVRTK